MNKNEMLIFMNQNPLSFLATIDGKKPRVRGMETYRADGNGLVFYSRKNKDVHKQLAKNPDVEVLYFNAKTMTALRVSGRIEIFEDIDLKKEIVSKRSFLEPLINKEGWENMSVYRLKNGKATMWSMATMTEPKTYVDL